MIRHKIVNALMLMMNAWGNNIPSRHFRRWFYRCMGAKIGNSIIFRSTEILEPQKLRIGNEVSIGWHCLLDSRGGCIIKDNVNISSYVKIITAGHDINNPNFTGKTSPVIIEKNVWLATGCTILMGVHIGEGAVVAAGAIVTRDVAPFTVVGGVPAKKIGDRNRNIDYTVGMPTILY